MYVEPGQGQFAHLPRPGRYAFVNGLPLRLASLDTLMPLPLIPAIAALVAGGTLVPHAAGGLIVTSVGGYVAGTYLSTVAISTLVASGVARQSG